MVFRAFGFENCRAVIVKCKLNVATMTLLCEAQALCDLGLVYRGCCAQGVSDPWKALTSVLRVWGSLRSLFLALTGCAGYSP